MLVTRAHFPDGAVDPSGSSNAQSDGGDLKFYSDSSLTNRLPCEVVQFAYDSSTGAGDAAIEVWVKVPSVSSAVDTVIYVTYHETDSQPSASATYGSEAVWDADFVGVWQLDQDPTGTVVDSTANGNDDFFGSMTSGDLGDGEAILFDESMTN